MENEVTRFPLAWPPGRPRTPSGNRAKAKFHSQQRRQGEYGVAIDRSPLSITEGRDELLKELERLNAREVIISTNLTLTRDLQVKGGQPQPRDPGRCGLLQIQGRGDGLRVRSVDAG